MGVWNENSATFCFLPYSYFSHSPLSIVAVKDCPSAKSASPSFAICLGTERSQTPYLTYPISWLFLYIQPLAIAPQAKRQSRVQMGLDKDRQMVVYFAANYISTVCAVSRQGLYYVSEIGAQHRASIYT